MSYEFLFVSDNLLPATINVISNSLTNFVLMVLIVGLSYTCLFAWIGKINYVKKVIKPPEISISLLPKPQGKGWHGRLPFHLEQLNDHQKARRRVYGFKTDSVIYSLKDLRIEN